MNIYAIEYVLWGTELEDYPPETDRGDLDDEGPEVQS